MIVCAKLDPMAYLPERAHDTDAGADIRTPRGFIIPPFGQRTVRTGVHVETPHEHASVLVSKSGLNVRKGITSTGLIDEGYDGEIAVKLYNHTPFFRRFKRGDKISQIVLMPVRYPTYVQVEEIHGGERGTQGFGSTGR